MGLIRAAFLLTASLAAMAAAPEAARAVDPAEVDGCHQAILKGLAAVSRGRIAIVGRCLKAGNFEACPENDNHGIAHENELRNFVAGESSHCAAALATGSVLADFGPTTCMDEWEDCDTEVPAIHTISDLAECLICQQRGLDFELRAELGLPRPEPADLGERRCTRRIARLAGNTIRKAIFDTARCAKGGTKPFSCDVDATTKSRFGRALATFAKNIGFCRIDEGQAPGVLTSLCGGTASDEASLTACFEGLAKCLACRTANSALGQSADCAAMSGFTGCDGMF